MFTAYCINLKRRADRREYMQRLADAAGFSLTFIDAVDAADETNRQALQGLLQKGPTGKLGDGALACTLSHAKAWKSFLETDHAAAVFLEDDVIVSADFTKVVAELLKHRDADLIKLECGGSAPDGLVVGRSLRDVGSRSLRPCYQIATDAAGYILTRKGAQQALDRLAACDVGVDHYLFYPILRTGGAGVPFAIVDPAVLIQDRSIGSNIAASRYTEGKWRRMLRRTFYEVRPVPHMLRHLIRSGVRVKKILFSE